MRTIIAAMALLLVSGCSGDDGDPSSKPTPSPTATATSPGGSDKSPRERLRSAQKGLVEAVGVSYYRRVYLGHDDRAMIQETGRFAVRRQIAILTRTMLLAPPDAAANNGSEFYQLSIRASKNVRYFQLANWGPYDNCWGELDNARLVELLEDSGIEVREIGTTPVPAALVLSATVSADATPAVATEPREGSAIPASSVVAGERAAVMTDGATALLMLGFDARSVAEFGADVHRIRVPATITYFVKYPDAVENVSLDGHKVARALQRGGIQLPDSVLSFLPELRAEAGFSPSSIPVEFDPPPANQVLPSVLGPGATCEINR